MQKKKKKKKDGLCSTKNVSSRDKMVAEGEDLVKGD